MTREEILAAIIDRFGKRWSRRCEQEGAAPVAVIAIKQVPGPDFGSPVVCTLETMQSFELGALLIGIGRALQMEGLQGN